MPALASVNKIDFSTLNECTIVPQWEKHCFEMLICYDIADRHTVPRSNVRHICIFSYMKWNATLGNKKIIDLES